MNRSAARHCRAEMKLDTKRNQLWMACGIALTWVGCSPVDLEVPEVETTQRPLYFVADKIRDERDIDVCWQDAGYAADKALVREALKGQRSWEAVGGMNFVGWDDCTGGEDIRIRAGDSYGVIYLQDPIDYAIMTLNFDDALNSQRCAIAGLNRDDCIQAVALHEFGHALGYTHEQNRPDEEGCSWGASGTNGDTTYGNFDIDAIMGHCNWTTELSGIEARGTAYVYGPHLGDHSNAGDYNGDGNDDIMCHSRIGGDVWVELANSSGEFSYNNFYSDNDWCRHDSARLYKGDFNGDGRTDLLCHNLEEGAVWVDYAGTSGQFYGTDWSIDNDWCRATGAYLHIGDFNGDGRDDLLCHNRVSGTVHVDYANASGRFYGTDWWANNSWCNAPGASLYVGSFDGNSSDDLLCHNVDNGWLHIDLASASGQFNGSNFSADTNWCVTGGAELRVGDFDGDGWDDLLCHNAGTGWKHIDYFWNGFTGTDWSRDAQWCRTNGARLYIGDFNGDGRDDMLCHNVATGWKHIDYANSAGEFNQTDWSLDSQYCRADGSKLH
ncbi:MAG: FG-GAP-like repeat-containing protein [Deltaproteobacteria bacterium]